MPRAIWSGAISFGLVNIPVKLYSAVSRKTVRFHQLDAESGQRIRQQRINPESGEEVPYEQIIKGYEISPDRYVTITPEELEALEPQKTRTIDIEEFVDLEQIDPIYYDHPYYLAPDKGAAKAYKLLLDAMEEADKVAIARVVIRSKENLVALRSYRGAITLETMLFPDEVIQPDSIEEVAATDGDVKTTKRELDMAKQLIESLSGDFDPSGEDILRNLTKHVHFDEVVRVALTRDQVEQYALPVMLGKATDTRASGFVKRHGQLVQVELEAMDVDDLRALCSAALSRYWNADAYTSVMAAEKSERAKLRELVELAA
mgnify:CR=1 FL=1